MLRFNKATYLSFLFKFILSKKFSNSLWVSNVLLFSDFRNIVSILFHDFVEFTILLYTFSRCAEYIICLISFNKFSAFTCAGAILNTWSLCLAVNIFSFFPSFALYLASDVIEE